MHNRVVENMKDEIGNRQKSAFCSAYSFEANEKITKTSAPFSSETSCNACLCFSDYKNFVLIAKISAWYVSSENTSENNA